jgi:predicted kinase
MERSLQRLIVMAGLPGTGKSCIAEAVGRELGSPVFAKDWLEVALRRVGLAQTLETAHLLGYTGYELLSALAERQLRLGQSAILDSVASTASIRTIWRTLATTYGAAGMWWNARAQLWHCTVSVCCPESAAFQTGRRWTGRRWSASSATMRHGKRSVSSSMRAAP